MKDLKEKVLRLLTEESCYEDFSELIDGPGWRFIDSMNLPLLDKFICLSLVLSASSIEELYEEAGLRKSVNRCGTLKRYWRRISKRLSKTSTYKADYTLQLDKEWKINESFGYSTLAKQCLSIHDTEQEAHNKGKLSVEHLKLRARLFVLRLFLNDLRMNIKKYKKKG